jgi:hypothetical protein
MPEFDVVGLSAGIEAVLSLAGRVEPHVTTSRQGVVLLYRAEWKAQRARAAGR